MKKLFFLLVLAFLGVSYAQTCGDGFRLFDHELLFGEPVCIPTNPQRIYNPFPHSLNTFILGADLIGLSSYVEMFAEEIPNAAPLRETTDPLLIGSYHTIDYESIATLEPDLIVSSSWYDGNDGLSQIAATVVLDDSSDPSWREVADFLAAATDTEGTLDLQVAQLNARLEQLKDDLRENLAGRTLTFSVIAPAWDAGLVNVINDGRAGPQILIEAGLELAPSIRSMAQINGAGEYDISLEALGTIDADYIVAASRGDADLDASIYETELWRLFTSSTDALIAETYGTLETYDRDNVVYAHIVIEDVYRNLLGQDPAEAGNPNPFADWLASE